MKIPFSKMSGTGNDFVVIDNRGDRVDAENHGLIRRICNRRTGVGADGLILADTGTRAPVRMRYFNRDGYEAGFCGNGARCTAYFAVKKGLARSEEFDLEAGDGIHRASVQGERVELGMSPPKAAVHRPGIVEEPGWEEWGLLNTGVDHFVIRVPDVDAVPVHEAGAYYRNHRTFPQGVNVNFVQTAGPGRIRIRTYERGVEEETLSCGTGCVASALLSSLYPTAGPGSRRLPFSVLLTARGGELTVTWRQENGTGGRGGTAGPEMPWRDIRLAGSVAMPYEGWLLSDRLTD